VAALCCISLPSETAHRRCLEEDDARRREAADRYVEEMRERWLERREEPRPPEISSGDQDGPIEIETWCGTVHTDGRRCGRRLGPWALRDGHVRPLPRLASTPKGRARHGPRPSVWRPVDEPVFFEEKYLQPSDVSNDPYYRNRPTRWWAVCPGCGNRTIVRVSTMARLMREAAERREAVLRI
jgi:hypothetical protein